MKELPTKEQILDDCHREIMQGIVPGSTRGFPIAYAPQSLCAMERYAALRAMPLVEVLKTIQKVYLPEIEKLYEEEGSIPREIKQIISKALSSYTGGADTQKKES